MIRKLIITLLIAVLLSTGMALAEEDIAFQEVKLYSQLYNGAAVGKTLIPAGWTLNVQDMFLTTGESITWPNSLLVTVTSPDGSVTMTYRSRRDFQQSTVSAMGIESSSGDDTIDQSNMMHMLNYRDGAGTCDLMVSILYPGQNHTFLSQRDSTAAEIQALEQYWQDFDSGLRQVFTAYPSESTLLGTGADIAERTYQSGDRKTIVNAFISWYETETQLYGATRDTIDWRMNSVLSMQAPEDVFDQYLDIFSIFVLNTTVSQEYEVMTNLHSQYLHNYYQMRQLGQNPSIEELETDLGNAQSETVSTGDNYSAIEGWSDVIREENDYTLSNGSHIKLSTSFDHVYEGSDGSIYAGYGSYYPEGTTELFPTPVGG